MPFRSLNADEVAVYLHVGRREVDQWVRAGEIPHEMRGGRAVFMRADIDAWASQRILALPGRRLVEYHRDSSAGTREHAGHEALMPVLIQPEYIRTVLEGKTKRSVIDDMVNLAEETDRVNDVAELLESIMEREDLCSTALPGGMAVLHCRNHDPYRFDGSFLVLGRSVQGIPFGAPDGRPTRFFFLLCSEEEQLHLHMLARLCLMAMNTTLLDLLHASASSDEMYQAIIDSELAALEGRRFLKKVDGDGEPVPEDAGAS
jgi:PTS system nitrogen regulatory IIA component